MHLNGYRFPSGLYGSLYRRGALLRRDLNVHALSVFRHGSSPASGRSVTTSKTLNAAGANGVVIWPSL